MNGSKAVDLSHPIAGAIVVALVIDLVVEEEVLASGFVNSLAAVDVTSIEQSLVSSDGAITLAEVGQDS